MTPRYESDDWLSGLLSEVSAPANVQWQSPRVSRSPFASLKPLFVSIATVAVTAGTVAAVATSAHLRILPSTGTAGSGGLGGTPNAVLVIPTHPAHATGKPSSPARQSASADASLTPSTPMPTSVLTPASSVSTPTPRPTAAPTPGAFVFAAAADSWVDSVNKTTNYGSSTTLTAASTPNLRHTYLRFTVAGVAGSVTSVKLKLFVQSGGGGVTVHHVSDNSWGESSITYATAPAYDSAGVTTTNPSSGSWVTVDITTIAGVTGNGTVSLALTSATSDTFLSREDAGGAYAPQLLITTS